MSDTEERPELSSRLALKVEEAAGRLNCCVRTVRTLLATDPSFPRFYLGRAVRLPEGGLREWVEEAARRERSGTVDAARALSGGRR